MGKIEVITGPMFAGKTTELMRRLERYALAKQTISYYVPEIDTRTQESITITTTRQEYKFTVQKLPVTVSGCMMPFTNVVAIDEVQFFDYKIIELCQSLKDMGVTVIVSGLDMDFLRRPFGCIGSLMAIADSVTKLTAICDCGNEARYTQRVSNGLAVAQIEQLVKIGDTGYEPRCECCYGI